MEQDQEFVTDGLLKLESMFGRDAVIQVVRLLGGCMVWVPRGGRVGSPKFKDMCNALGDPGGERLKQEFGGREVYIPTGVKEVSQSVQQAVRLRRAEGATRRELAKEFGRSERTISTYLRP